MQGYEAGPGVEKGPRLAWVCTYTPEELIQAAGLVPYRLGALTCRPRQAAAWLPPDFCSYALALAEEAFLAEGYRLVGAVLANSCQAMLHLYNLWSRIRPQDAVYLLEVPRQSGEEAVTYFAAALRELWQQLVVRFSVEVPEEKLEQAIRIYREARVLVRRLLVLRRHHPPPLNGIQIAEVLALAARTSKDRFVSWLADRLPFWEEAARQGRIVSGQPLPGTSTEPGPKAGSTRVLLTGCVAPTSLIASLEEHGVTVVADDLCSGGRYLVEGEEPTYSSADPFPYLARAYLKRPPCPRMVQGEERWKELIRLVREYRAQGVIYFSLKFCDYHHYAFPLLRQRLRAEGIPLLRLEGEYHSPPGGQVSTRVQAFVEALGVRGEVTG
ncbi:MAG: 2-hydroxyacyl-CoA dehydratase subunit D [Moorellales bacterium]